MKRNIGKPAGLLAAVLALSLVITLAVGPSLSAGASGNTLTKEQISAVVDTATDTSQITSPFIQVAKQARDSVVGVNNYQTVRRSQFGYNFGFPFDSLPGGEQEQRAGTGSGTVISPWGHVLTNYHVIENASRVTVSIGEKELAATIVGSDSELDIAVLLSPDLDLPAVPLGDSDAIQVGEYAIVIGNPLGQQFERSVTVGVVSAVARKMASSNRDRFGLVTKNENLMIQVDAPISSGNSGGGMFNTLGQLQGIPTLKLVDNNGGFFSSSGYSVDNIGMCVPINSAKPLIRSVLENYNPSGAQAQAKPDQTQPVQPSRPRIGVSVGTLSPNWAPVAQGTLPQGAYVANVEKGSPAEAAGLKIGDIIVEADGTAITTQTGLITKLQGMKEGEFVQLKVYRVPGLPEALENSELAQKLGRGEYLDFKVQLLILDPSHM